MPLLPQTRLQLPVRTLHSLLALTFVFMTVAGLASEVSIWVLDDPWGWGLVPMVNLAYESNVPTWYTAVLLLGCGGLLGVIGAVRTVQHAPYRRHWIALAIAFGYLSMDEAAMIHEIINEPLGEVLPAGGWLVFSWVIPFGIVVALVGVAYLGFLAHLPSRFRWWFIAAGVVYVGGALGTELPISWWAFHHGDENLTYGLMNVGQESLEILGASLFCAALLVYLRDEVGEVQLRFTCGPSDLLAPHRPDEPVVPEVHQGDDQDDAQ